MYHIKNRHLLALGLAIGVIQVAAYWLIGILSAPGSAIASPQPDTLLYCQAARRIVEGSPFSFAAGSLPSTGTTSVLYPFILAIPYALGWRGDLILSAGFVLNALFYLVFLTGWSASFCKWIENPSARFLAIVLLCLFGPSAFGALSQSDIGLWMATSGVFVGLLAWERRAFFGLALLLAPWVRPEGMVCVLAFAMVSFFTPLRRRGDRLLALVGIASMMGVFCLNYALTGEFQFSSVAHKGYFKMFAFPVAVHRTVTDAMDMLKMLVFGQAHSMPRDIFFMPFIGAVFFWLGLCAHDWRDVRSRALAVALLAVVGGFATVAQSGWQDTNYDRYLAWCFPVVILFMAEGAVALSDHFKRRELKWSIPTLLVAFELVASMTLVADYSYRCAKGHENQEFAKAAGREMKAQATVGGWGWSGMAYYFGNRPFAHLSGIYSPQYTYASDEARLEELRREAAKRFDYWLLTDEFRNLRMSDKGTDVFGPTLLVGPSGVEVRQCDWSAFDQAERFPLPEMGEKLSDRVDVGYQAEEIKHTYRVIDRFDRKPGDIIPFAERLSGAMAVDAGRLLQGGDVMAVDLMPGRDVRVVMRTAHAARTSIVDGFENPSLYGEFPDSLRLNVAVSGKVVATPELHVSTNGFSDVSFVIPGSAIETPSTTIAFLGDHIACGYWFFQSDHD